MLSHSPLQREFSFGFSFPTSMFLMALSSQSTPTFGSCFHQSMKEVQVQCSVSESRLSPSTIGSIPHRVPGFRFCVWCFPLNGLSHSPGYHTKEICLETKGMCNSACKLLNTSLLWNKILVKRFLFLRVKLTRVLLHTLTDSFEEPIFLHQHTLWKLHCPKNWLIRVMCIEVASDFYTWWKRILKV